ncbi:MAG TPA: hypothetical protein VFN35_07930 [Ktedonobacteraceae bacterium]|nr:hypothetical protein [Ktedonobacteraceae bacterium]
MSDIVRDLTIVVGTSESGISHHLRFLRGHHLVKAIEESTTIYHSVDNEHVAALFQEAAYYTDHVHQSLPNHS